MVSLFELKSLSSFFLHNSDAEKNPTNKNFSQIDGGTSSDHSFDHRPQCGGYNEAFILERWAHFEHPER